MAREALADLHQRMLRVARLGAVRKVPVQIRVAQLAAEPGSIPEEKRERHQRQDEQRDQKVSSSAGTAVRRGRLWSHPKLMIPQAGLIAIEEGVEGHYDLGIFGAELADFRDCALGAAPSLAGARVDDPDVADAEVEVV